MKKLRYGMVGGGQGAFIGAVHRSAMGVDGEFALAAGCFSSSPERSKASGEALGVAAERVYGSFDEMAQAEAALPKSERIDFVSIVTPNHAHFPAAKTFLEAGFPVVCDKPVTHSLEQAKALREIVQSTGQLFCLTHNYTGYPMVKQARALVAAGKLGELRKVVVEYPQGWLGDPIDQEGQKQASWRTDPEKAGAGGALGDIGSHAANLVSYIAGLKLESLCADLTSFVPGRKLDDDSNVLVRYQGGAKGVLYASQISTGEENALSIRLYGTQGALEWHQEHPNDLHFTPVNEPEQILRPGNPYLDGHAGGFVRLPAGHPEGFIEAFANVYRCFGKALRAKLDGSFTKVADYDFPTIDDGVEGLAFIETAVASARTEQKWTPVPSV
ncbi:MAG: Gfo/Idh/MocA family protein [Opitutales bacterium]